MLTVGCTGTAAPPVSDTAPPTTLPDIAAASPAVVTSSPAVAGSQPALPPDKLVMSYSSVAGTYAPIYLAVENGFFAQHGLDVDLTYVASGTTSMQSLVAGDVQFIVTGGPEPIAASLAGVPARIVAGWTRSISAKFMVDSSITVPSQLRDKPIGVSRFGGQPHIAARLALKHWGLDPQTDVQFLQMGGLPEILGGMQVGAVVGGVVSPPSNVQAQRLGFHVLGDLAEMGIQYQSEVIVSLQGSLRRIA
jgi:ABC-type nitrate/sulfonate/bicarbonate transport system substrate-binding protein